MNESQTVESPKTQTQLLDRMVEAKQLSLADAGILAQQAAKGKPELVESEDNVLRWLANEYHLSFTTLENIEPDRELLSLFPARVLLKEELLPLQRLNGVVQVATSRLFATQGLDTLKTLTGLKIQPVLAPAEAIRREMKTRLGIGADTIDTLDEDAPLQVVDEGGDENADLESAAEDASIIKFVNQVFTDAIELRASDIHLEPFEEELRIRYRIDGVLQEVPVPAQIKRFQPAIVSRVKILSHLNIAEKRLPQDGRIKLRLANNEVDVRVSIIPMLHGEAVVMRLLRQKGTLLGMSELGMGDNEIKSFKRILALPHGIILVTGPTGSGKTTTLYTALNEINDLETKIITIEDPIEYQLKGVNQIQVNEKAGLTFARGLRSILRHDPDVVLVGEIRDEETAQIAVQASLTGHLAHQRRAGRADPAGGHERGALFGGFLAGSGAGATPGARPLSRMQGGGPIAHRRRVEGAVGLSRQSSILPRGRLRGLPPDGFPWPAGHFRVDGYQQRNPANAPEKLLQRRDPRGGSAQRHEELERRRLAPGARRRHHARRSHARHQGSDPDRRLQEGRGGGCRV